MAVPFERVSETTCYHSGVELKIFFMKKDGYQDRKLGFVEGVFFLLCTIGKSPLNYHLGYYVYIFFTSIVAMQSSKLRHFFSSNPGGRSN